MSMIGGLVIAAVILFALVYAYREHASQARRLTRIFSRLRGVYGGRIEGTRLLALPQLRFQLDGRRYLVTAMASSGHVNAGASGYSGPFTFVDVEMPHTTGTRARVVRSAGIAERIVEQLTPGQPVETGDEAFDAEYRIRASDGDFALEVLDAAFRQRLMASALPRLDVRLDGRTTSVHMDGYARSGAEIEELIGLARHLADRCECVRAAGQSD